MTSISDWWQGVSATATQGLQITAVGMSLVFLTLGLIILVLALLTRLPELRRRKGREPDSRTHRQPASSTATKDREAIAQTVRPAPTSIDAELEQVAAIAVALARSQPLAGRRSRRRTAQRSDAPPSRWAQYGRAHQLGL